MIINPEQFEILKQKYEESKNKNKKTFIFMNQKYLTSYAKYLIEYMESRQNKNISGMTERDRIIPSVENEEGFKVGDEVHLIKHNNIWSGTIIKTMKHSVRVSAFINSRVISKDETYVITKETYRGIIKK